MTKGKYILALTLIGFAVYFNSLFNGFVWDDEEQILLNLPAHTISNFFQFFAGSTFNSGGASQLAGLYYKPMMTLFYSLLYTLFGPNAFFFHLFQLILHILNSILIFLMFGYFLKASTKNYLLPFLLALVFLVHPINVEPTVYIASLQDVLFFIFGVVLFILTIKSKMHYMKYIAVGALLLLMSLLSKETGAVFGLLIFIYIILFNIERLGSYIWAGGIAMGSYIILRFAIAGVAIQKHNLSPITRLDFSDRLISIPKIMFFNIKTFFYPNDLAISQHWVVSRISWSNFYLPLLVDFIFLATIAAGGIILYKIKSNLFKTYIFFLIWFIIALTFHLQLYPLDLTVADRWFYMPIVGLLGIIGVYLFLLLKKINNLHKTVSFVFYTALMIIIASLMLRTITRNSDWKDGYTLYSHDIAIAQNSFDLENNLGVELYRKGDLTQAKAHFENSTIIAPYWWTNWNNLAAILEREGDFNKAALYYEKAIANGNYYLAYENLANILAFHDDPAKAKKFTEQALTVLPNNPRLYFILAYTNYKLGDKQGALTAAQKSLILNPNYQPSLYIYQRLSQNLPIE